MGKKGNNEPLSRKARRQFMDLIKTDDPEKCWNWNGSFMRGDYPLFYGDGKQQPAVRILYRLYYTNYLKRDWVIRHTCGNNWCMNPNHIYRDTRANASKETQMERRRFTIGERHPQSRLTEKDVLNIRERVANKETTQKALAEEYGVTEAHISKIIKRKTWTHI